LEGQGSIAVVALILAVVLTTMVALYVSTMGRLVELSNYVKQLIESSRLASAEKLNLSVSQYDYLTVSLGFLYSFTLVHAVVQLNNVGSVSTAVEGVIVSCLVNGENVLSFPTSFASALALEPGSSKSIELNTFLPLYCSEVSITFVTMYGNSYTVYIPVS